MIVKRDFIYTPKGKNRPLHIYLPDDYATSGKHYPVVYFLDGHNLYFDEDKAAFVEGFKAAGELDEISENLIDAASAVSGCGPAFVYMFI